MHWVGETTKYFATDLQVFRLRMADLDRTAPEGHHVDAMRGMTWDRWAAASGLVALGVAGAAVSFERSTPNPDPSDAEVIGFYVDNRSA